MFTDQTMGLFDIRTGRIDNRESFCACFFKYGIAYAVGSKNDDAFIDLIKQFKTGKTWRFQTPDPEFLTRFHYIPVMHDHSQHADFLIRISFRSLPGNLNCPDHTLTVPSRDNFDNLHRTSAVNPL